MTVFNPFPPLGGNNVWTGNETHSGTEAFSGDVSIKNLNNALYADQFPGADIGAQINAAYEALPPFGGKIFIPQKSDGSIYDFSTPIIFSTVGKYVVLEGLGASANTTGNVHGQVTLNYTPTTATSALTLDWTPTTGGGFTPGAGLRNLTLINNNGSTAGGTGSSATGISLGPVNAGAEAGTFESVKVQGFGKGLWVQDASGAGWGMRFFNCCFAFNNTGLLYDVPHEQDSYFGCTVMQNGVGINLNAYGAEISLFGGSVDSNTVHGVVLADGAILHANAVHWENNPSTTVSYVYSTGSGSYLDIIGGTAYDVVASGSQSANWFSAGYLTVHGLSLITFGRATSANIFSANTIGFADVVVNDSTLLPNIIYIGGGAGGSIVTSNPTISAFIPSFGTSSLTLSGTGGASQVLRQSSSGAAVTVGQLAASELTNGTTGSGKVALETDPTFTGNQTTFQAALGVALGQTRWKPASGSDQWSIGNKDSGGGDTNDLVYSSFNGSSWAEIFRLLLAGGVKAAALIATGATPTGSGTDLSMGITTGFGNGSAGTAVTTTTKNTGSGPATPQTVVNYLEIDIGGAKYWIPLVQ